VAPAVVGELFQLRINGGTSNNLNLQRASKGEAFNPKIFVTCFAERRETLTRILSTDGFSET
jgi:hypothetical protein